MIRRARLRRAALLAAAPLAPALAAFLIARPLLKASLRGRIEREAAARGLVASVEAVRVGVWPPLALAGLRVEKPGSWSASVERAEARVRPWGRGLLGRTRLALGRATLHGPAGLALEIAPTRWDLFTSRGGRWRAELRQPAGRLAVAWLPWPGGGSVEVTGREIPLGSFVTLRRHGEPLLDPGTVSVALRVTREPGATQFDGDVAARGLRMAALSRDAPTDAVTGEPLALGPPTDVALHLGCSWRPEEGAFDVRHVSLGGRGVSVSGWLSLKGLGADPALDLSVEVERVDFAEVLEASGLEAPGADLGSASFSARLTGRLRDARSFAVSQRLDFAPPRRIPRAIERLHGDFLHEVVLPGGGSRAIDVSPASPDFIPLDGVPPLFLRTLLLAEDAGFWGHSGVDVSELPAAVLTNWERGRPVRGGSTITQQLAKNLFLTREKTLGRKLRELPLALLLEAALGKRRILEIYLNVIEWGPGLYGLRPASRHYFDREPGDLTPAQTAFLVALIPGPVKYQRSLAGGTPSPGFRSLVADLLAKLRSVDALGEEEYRAALAEDLRVRT